MYEIKSTDNKIIISVDRRMLSNEAYLNFWRDLNLNSLQKM